MPTRGEGTREEDVGEDEEDLEAEEETSEEEETEEVKGETSRVSPASTAGGRDTRPPLAQVPRSLEEIDEMRREETVKGENGKPLR